LEFSDGLGLSGAGVKMPEDFDLNGQQAAGTRQGVDEDACLASGDSEGEADVFVMPEFSALISSSHLQGHVYHYLYC
jgi:hypothetical protein